ncbi:MAG TPA: antibiotic biosynthesis monooxygenase, partial [Candidatus Acidoferrales bacterium]
ILPNKVEEFVASVQSVIPMLHQQKGFRGLLVLQGDATAPQEATVVALWDSLEALRASEKSMFLYQALSRILTSCEGFPVIREQKVMISDSCGHS